MIDSACTRMTAYPVRIIPFDLGRQLMEKDVEDIYVYTQHSCEAIELSSRQSSILKDCMLSLRIKENVELYLFSNGICVIVIHDSLLELTECYRNFSIAYGENRKVAHANLFSWTHPESLIINSLISELRTIVHRNSRKPKKLRISASKDFENKGLSYIMTLSMFDIDPNQIIGKKFMDYSGWLKSNLTALLDPSVLYLEDSSKFMSVNEIDFDMSGILNSLDTDIDLKDYERHHHMATYMSWAAVVLVGQIQPSDCEEYISLEVQLQCDWFYVYCLDKCLGGALKEKNGIIELQRQGYELDILENRLYDFDDSSMPSRVLDIQKGLVNTSGLETNITHLQRKVRFFLEREQLNAGLKQKKLGQSSEILLFVIAFIEIAPTVVEYGNKLYPNIGYIASCLIIVVGLLLFIRKN